MASISSSSLIISPQNLFSSKTHLTFPLKNPSFLSLKPNSSLIHLKSTRLLAAVAEGASVDTSSEAARRLYVGNIPRTVDNNQLSKIVEEHGAVEKAEVFSTTSFTPACFPELFVGLCWFFWWKIWFWCNVVEFWGLLWTCMCLYNVKN